MVYQAQDIVNIPLHTEA